MKATKRVLIVDDEEHIRDVLQVSLEEFAGWLTIAATSGTEGIQLARTELPDAIIMDISMPDMDGFALYEHLQSDSATQTIPLIVLTAKVLPSDRHRFAKLKVAGVITKPFDPMTIWREIAEILDWNI